jgi:hypothetical protein
VEAELPFVGTGWGRPAPVGTLQEWEEADNAVQTVKSLCSRALTTRPRPQVSGPTPSQDSPTLPP